MKKRGRPPGQKNKSYSLSLPVVVMAGVDAKRGQQGRSGFVAKAIQNELSK